MQSGSAAAPRGPGRGLTCSSSSGEHPREASASGHTHRVTRSPPPTSLSSCAVPRERTAQLQACRVYPAHATRLSRDQTSMYSTVRFDSNARRGLQLVWGGHTCCTQPQSTSWTGAPSKAGSNRTLSVDMWHSAVAAAHTLPFVLSQKERKELA